MTRPDQWLPIIFSSNVSEDSLAFAGRWYPFHLFLKFWKAHSDLFFKLTQWTEGPLSFVNSSVLTFFKYLDDVARFIHLWRLLSSQVFM